MQEIQDRKLASIQKIINITPIPNADRIELARIKDWKVVVQKDQFKVGDLCVFIQIDSVLPEKQEFEFMRERKFRVRTIKLRKQISQGIAFPLHILPSEYTTNSKKTRLLKEEYDVTKILDIKKWEPWKKPVRLYQKEYENLTFWQKIKEKIFNIKIQRTRKRWGFPTHLVPQTTEIRIQNSPSILRGYKGDLVSVTEKLDGTSATYLIYKKRNKQYFLVCSRGMIRNKKLEDEYSKDKNIVAYYPYWTIAEKYDIKNKIKIIGIKYAIQGEIIGSTIENGSGITYGIPDREFYIFNIYDMQAQKYVDRYKFKELCKKMKLPTVPFLGIMKLPETIEEINSISHGISKINKNFLREGTVFRSINITNKSWDISFKYVDPEFELKYGLKKHIRRHKK